MASSAPLRRSCSCDQHSHHDSLKGNCSHQRLPACGALSHTGKHPASVLSPAWSSSEAGLEGLGNVWLSSCRSTESGDDRPGGRVAGVLSTEGPFQGQNSPLEPRSCAGRRVWRPRASGLILRKERAAGAPCTPPPPKLPPDRAGFRHVSSFTEGFKEKGWLFLGLTAGGHAEGG